MKSTVPELLDKLMAHGSLDQIAHELEVEGIQGLCHDPGYCVIAEWLTKQGLEYVSVYPDGGVGGNAKIYSRVKSGVGGLDVTPLPSMLNELAIRFDNRCYPELIRGGGE